METRKCREKRQNEAKFALALLPRQESFASLHILTRRASEGSEALPSLARRVRMSFFGARVIVHEWFAVRTRNGEIKLENKANLRLVMGRPEGIGRDGLGARREECPVACESEETESAVMEKRQNKAKLWFGFSHWQIAF